jgi:hypothetical protein
MIIQRRFWRRLAHPALPETWPRTQYVVAKQLGSVLSSVRIPENRMLLQPVNFKYSRLLAVSIPSFSAIALAGLVFLVVIMK